MSFKNIDSVYKFLERLPKFQSEGVSAANFDLSSFREFCRRMGDPQNRFPSIHVAGTNGKGSTCQILAAVYRSAGYRVGLYTSPHLLDFRERFVINGARIPKNELQRFFRLHEDLIAGYGLTYFELSTAIAFWWFAGREVDLAVIETGLGGRLDATNIITPLLSVITNVSEDHTNILGKDVRDIAAEKAGIIKSGIPVVTGNIEDRPLEVITRRANEKGAHLHKAARLEPVMQDGICLLSEQGELVRLETDLVQPVQRWNIALAWKAVSLLQQRLPVSKEAFEQALAEAGTRYLSRARFERLLPDRHWYFDGAHNIEAIRALKQSVSGIGPVSESILILSMMSDKVTKPVAEQFSEFKKILYYTPNTDRAASLEQVQTLIPPVVAFPSGTQERNRFFKEIASELVIFAGSFYFYQTVRGWLKAYIQDR